MKIRKEKVKECKNSDGTNTKVLDIEYTHKGETGRVLIKDYIETDYKKIIKQIRKAAIEQYNLIQKEGVQ